MTLQSPDFPGMALSIKSKIPTRGYSFIEALEPNKDSISVAGAIGEVITPWEGGQVQQLVPRASSTPNTYSGIYRLDRFPFHTDLAHRRHPPRYLMLRCVKGYADVSTWLLDGSVVFEEVTLDVLARAIVKPRRPQGGTVPLLRLCEATEFGYRLRWDEQFLKPASKIGQLAFERMRKYLSHSESQSISLKLPGDTLLIDNWRMLHARSPIPSGCEDRKIERIYLEKLN